MANRVEISGRVFGSVESTSAKEGHESDFIIMDRWQFQVICESELARGLKAGARITVIGELRENGGDVYIWGTEIIPDKQMELGF